MRNNDLQYIKKLIDAFYEGNTSREEEQILHEYFLEELVPGELEHDKEIFLELYSPEEDVIPFSLEQKLNSLIDRLDAEETKKTPVVSIKPKSINLRRIASIAASILIVLSIGIYYHFNKADSQTIADTYTNPEDAYMETEKALLFVSTKLNKGFDQVESAQKNLEKTNKIISKNIHL